MKNQNITKINFIDTSINKIGLIRIIKVLGKLLIVMSILPLLSIPAYLLTWNTMYLKYISYDINTTFVIINLIKEILIAIIGIIVGLGLLKLKKWGRWSYIIMNLIGILNITIYEPFLKIPNINFKLPESTNEIIGIYIIIVLILPINILMIYIFTRPQVKKVFK